MYLIDVEIERLEPLRFIIKTPWANLSLLFKEFCSYLHSPASFLYTRLSCFSNNAFTLQETGNIKYLQGEEIRKRDCQKYPEFSPKPKG